MATTKQRRPPSLRTLKATRGVLERTLNYYEAVGFDITEYQMLAADDYKGGRKGQVNVGPVCHIGGIRLAAGVRPEPDSVETASGDGPELRVALELADEAAGAAKRHLPKPVRGLMEERITAAEDEPGRLAEAYGFAVHKGFVKYRETFAESADQTKKAIALIRSALRILHKKIEAAEA